VSPLQLYLEEWYTLIHFFRSLSFQAYLNIGVSAAPSIEAARNLLRSIYASHRIYTKRDVMFDANNTSVTNQSNCPPIVFENNSFEAVSSGIEK
jgi:hypothetical protein